MAKEPSRLARIIAIVFFLGVVAVPLVWAGSCAWRWAGTPAENEPTAGSDLDVCDHFYDWRVFDNEMQRMQRKYGDQTADWPGYELERFARVVDERALTASAMWDAAPDGLRTWSDVRSHC